MTEPWVVEPDRRVRRTWWMPVLAVLVAIILILLTRLVVTTFLLSFTQLNSCSMLPTIRNTERVLVLIMPALRGPVTRGSMVRYGYPERHAQLISRVVGLPGDRVELRGGLMYVNGRPADDPARLQLLRDARCINPTLPMNNAAYWTGRDTPRQSVMVPAGTIFVLSDNRAEEYYDSRMLGPIPTQQVTGVVRTDGHPGVALDAAQCHDMPVG